jgi:ABC-2 type transport system permease protein
MNHTNSFTTLLKTELKLILRDGNIIIFGIVIPVGIMFVIGFLVPAQGLTASFAGVAGIGILATGIMGIPVTLAQYRHDGVLKQFKVTPVNPAMLLAVDALLEVFFVLFSATLVSGVAHFVFHVQIASAGRFVFIYLFNIFVIYSIGNLIGALVPDIQTCNSVTTIIYFPSLILSGTTIPFAMLPRALRIIAELFPMTQANILLSSAALGVTGPYDFVRFGILAAGAIVCYAVSVKVFRW